MSNHDCAAVSDTVGAVVRWDPERFKEPARRVIVTMEMYLQEEEWDKLEEGARLLYSALLTRHDRTANATLHLQGGATAEPCNGESGCSTTEESR